LFLTFLQLKTKAKKVEQKTKKKTTAKRPRDSDDPTNIEVVIMMLGHLFPLRGLRESTAVFYLRVVISIHTLLRKCTFYS